jgi:hypothetical protein
MFVVATHRSCVFGCVTLQSGYPRVNGIENERTMAQIQNCSDAALVGKPRNDAIERLRKAHEGATYDKWFRESVEIALAETEYVTNEDAIAIFAKKKADLLKRAEGSAA